MIRLKEPIPTLLLFSCVWLMVIKAPPSADSAQPPPTSAGKSRVKEAATKSPGSANTIEMKTASCSGNDLLDPMCRFWSTAPAATIALQPQNIVTPYGGGSINTVLVKGLRLGSGVAFRLEWKDETKDNDTVHQTKFRDAVAIEFPLGTTSDTVLAMGSPHGPVNIWQWKADWEQDAPVMNDKPYDSDVDSPSIGSSQSVYKRLHVDTPKEANTAQGRGGPVSGIYNLFPQSSHHSPVEDLVAVGISSVTSKPERFQTIKGRGVWRDGRWHVVIYKPLVEKKDEACPGFAPKSTINAAVAVWNGSKQERNGMKSLSNWVTLRIH